MVEFYVADQIPGSQFFDAMKSQTGCGRPASFCEPRRRNQPDADTHSTAGRFLYSSLRQHHRPVAYYSFRQTRHDAVHLAHRIKLQHRLNLPCGGEL
jgi:hypothetical protein